MKTGKISGLWLILCLMSLFLPGCSSAPKRASPFAIETRQWACVGTPAGGWSCHDGSFDDLAAEQHTPQTIPAQVVGQPAETADIPAESPPDEALISDAGDVSLEAISSESAGAAIVAEDPSMTDSELQAALLAEPLGISESQLTDEQIVLNSPDNHYALQVIAARSAAEVRKFFETARLKLDGPALNVKIQSESGVWYVGIAAIFADYASAEIAVANLTLPGETWIRSVRGLKSAILAAAN